MVGMAYLVKIGLIKNWAALSKAVVGVSRLFLRFGSDVGAMQVILKGEDFCASPKQVKWTLFAPKGIGPHIPTLSTIILARKLLVDEGDVPHLEAGAKPCVGLLELRDFSAYFEALDIRMEENVSALNELEPY